MQYIVTIFLFRTNKSANTACAVMERSELTEKESNEAYSAAVRIRKLERRNKSLIVGSFAAAAVVAVIVVLVIMLRPNECEKTNEKPETDKCMCNQLYCMF